MPLYLHVAVRRSVSVINQNGPRCVAFCCPRSNDWETPSNTLDILEPPDCRLMSLLSSYVSFFLLLLLRFGSLGRLGFLHVLQRVRRLVAVVEVHKNCEEEKPTLLHLNLFHSTTSLDFVSKRSYCSFPLIVEVTDISDKEICIRLHRLPIVRSNLPLWFSDSPKRTARFQTERDEMERIRLTTNCFSPANSFFASISPF